MSSITTIQTSEASSAQDALRSHEEQVGAEGLIILFTFVGLLVGAILREGSKKTKIPYTPLMLAVGLFTAFYVEKFGILGQATKLSLLIEPHGILMVFIPTLIFESAFNADWYIFKKALLNIVLLAIPGVLFTTLMLAVVLKVFLQYDDDIKWTEALTLGSILALTDPAAILALLRDLGAPGKFNLLMQGESLLNGGVAMVFFTLFMNIAGPTYRSGGQYALDFFQMIAGGPLLGFLVGVIASMWLKKITRDNTLSISITFISCYLLFFTAETQFHVSGILALVTLGMFMSAYGKTKIDQDAEQALHAVWNWVQYVCETLIFLLAGLFLGIEVLSKQNSTIDSSDWIKMLFFYLFLIASRIVMVGGLYQILKRNGYGFSEKEFIVLVWGGVRGALGLALALIVFVDDYFSERARDLILFHTVGLTILTLLINGTTCSWFVRRLEMAMEPQIKTRLQSNLIKEMIMQSKGRIEKLKGDKFLILSNWTAVLNLVGNEELVREFDKSDRHLDSETEMHHLNIITNHISPYDEFKDDDVYQETRFRLLRIMKGRYWEKFEQGLLSGEAARLLVEGVNISLDRTERSIDLWSFLSEYFTSFNLIKVFIKVKDFFVVGRLAKRFVISHMSFIYEVTTAFIEVCEEILETGDEVNLSKHHIKGIMEEIDKNKNDAENYLLDLQGHFLEIMKAIQIQRAANQILDYQKHFLEAKLHSGQIEEKEYAMIRRKIDRKLNSLDNFKIDWRLPNFHEFILEFPIFSDLTPEDAKEVLKDSRTVSFFKGDFLYELNQSCHGIFFVTKGRVIESITSKKTESRGVGSILSFANMVNEDKRAVTTCEAFGDVQTTFVPFESLDSVLKKNEAFEEKVYKNAFITFIQLNQSRKISDLKFDEIRINEILRRSTFRTLRDGETFKLENGGFLFNGAITKGISSDETERFKAEKFSLVWPTNSELVATKMSRILDFDGRVREMLTRHAEPLSAGFKETYFSGELPKKSERISFRDAFQRDMFDKEFRSMMGAVKHDDYMS